MEENLNGNEVLNSSEEVVKTLKYSITLDQFVYAFKQFQKKYVFPKNYAMTAGFGIILIAYVYQIIKDPNFQVAWFLSLVSAAAIISIWWNVYSIRKKLIKSIKDIKDDQYTTTLTKKDISIQTDAVEITEGQEENPSPVSPTVINFELDMPDVIEDKNMFIVYLKKQMFYVIPKNDLSEEEISAVSETFKNAIGKRYTSRI